MLEIKSVQQLDVVKIFDLERENFQEYEQYSISMLNDCLKSNNYLFYKLVSNNEIISYIILLKSVDEYEILKICTSSKCKNKGFARFLLKGIIEMFNVHKIFLEVRESNLVAQKFYQSINFKTIGKRAKYYGNEDAILMKYSI